MPNVFISPLILSRECSQVPVWVKSRGGCPCKCTAKAGAGKGRRVCKSVHWVWKDWGSCFGTQGTVMVACLPVHAPSCPRSRAFGSWAEKEHIEFFCWLLCPETSHGVILRPVWFFIKKTINQNQNHPPSPEITKILPQNPTVFFSFSEKQEMISSYHNCWIYFQGGRVSKAVILHSSFNI